MIGVLAMAVDCGEFNVLEKKLPKGHEVVLIDMRESTIDKTTATGTDFASSARRRLWQRRTTAVGWT